MRVRRFRHDRSGHMTAWKCEYDRAAIAELAFNRHRTARLVHEPVHLRQAKSGPLPHGFGGEERIEDFLDDLRRNASPGVSQTQFDMVGVGSSPSRTTRCRNIARR